LENEDNEEKRMRVFTDNRINWKPIEEEVREWTKSSWSRWEREQPAWFNAVTKAMIPDDFIPAEAVLELGGVSRARRGSARLSSISATVDEALDLRKRLSRVGVEPIEEVAES
jgi:hypothetical protein